MDVHTRVKMRTEHLIAWCRGEGFTEAKVASVSTPHVLKLFNVTNAMELSETIVGAVNGGADHFHDAFRNAIVPQLSEDGSRFLALSERRELYRATVQVSPRTLIRWERKGALPVAWFGAHIENSHMKMSRLEEENEKLKQLLQQQGLMIRQLQHELRRR